MEKREIIASIVKSNNSDNNVWAVSITGDEQPSAHCKTAYKAMRFMFLLKKQTGLYIAAESLVQLSAGCDLLRNLYLCKVNNIYLHLSSP